MVSNPTIREIPRSQILDDIESDFIYLPFREQSGNTVQNLGNALSPSYTVAGTTTNIWDNPGELQFSGDNYIADSSQEMRNFARLDTLQHNLLWGFWLNMPGNTQTATETVFCHTPDATPNDGYWVDVIANGGMRMQFRNLATGIDAPISINSASLPWPSGEAAVLFNIDASTQSVDAYVGGVLVQSGDLSSWMGVSLSPDQGMTIGGKINRFGASSELLDSNSSGIRLSAFFGLRSNADISSDVAEIAYDLHTYKHELPYVLRGL